MSTEEGKALTFTVHVDEEKAIKIIKEQIELIIENKKDAEMQSLIDWLGDKADECGRKLDRIDDEYSAEFGYWEGYMECCNQLITKIEKGEFKGED